MNVITEGDGPYDRATIRPGQGGPRASRPLRRGKDRTLPGPPGIAGTSTETGQPAGEDGSVAPVIGGLPAVEGSAWDIGAPLDERGAGLAEELGSSPGPARPGREDMRSS